MNDYEKKMIAYVSIGLGSLVAFIFDIASSQDSGVKAIIAVMILVIAGCLVYLIHYKDVQGIQDPQANSETTEKITEKDYIRQMADDIHLIKIIVIAFAAISVITTLITLVSLADLFSRF